MLLSLRVGCLAAAWASAAVAAAHPPAANRTRPVAAVDQRSNATAGRLSRCGGAGQAIDCEHEVAYIQERWVGYQVPLGQPPAEGWPVVVIYHGWNLWNSYVTRTRSCSARRACTRRSAAPALWRAPADGD